MSHDVESDDTWADKILVRPARRESSTAPCPWCGCPCATLMIMSVLCANPSCRWHDARYGVELPGNARLTVVRWLSA